MDNYNSLHVVGSEDEANNYKKPFFIDREIGRFNESEKDNIFQYLANLDVSSATEIPLYELIWPHIVLQARGDLLELIILHKRLEKRLCGGQINTIICHNLEYKHKCVVADVADQYDILINESPERSKWRTYFSVVVTTIIFLLDQVLLLPFPRGNINRETIFYLYGDKLGRISSVIQSHNGKSINLVSWLNIRYLWQQWRGEHELRLRPINSIVTLRDIRAEIKFVARYLQEIKSDRMIKNLRQTLSKDLDVQMSRSVRYACLFAVKRDIRMLLTGIITNTLHDDISPKKILINGPSPRERAIISVTSDTPIEQYYLPHGIGGIQEVVPGRDIKQFVPGKISIEYLNRIYRNNTPEFINTGLPHLSELHRHSSNSYQLKDSKTYVTIATQPVDDSICSKFVKMALKGVQQLPTDPTIIVKLHPNDDKKIYEDAIKSLNLDNERDIKIVDGDLKYYLTVSDFIITMTSNVGLEAMIFGTPCVSLIPWNIFSQPLYVRQGPVPYFSSAQEIEEFCGGLSLDRIRQMEHEQHTFLTDNINLNEGAAGIIASHLECDSAN